MPFLFFSAVVGVRANNKRREQPKLKRKQAGHPARSVVGETHDNGRRKRWYDFKSCHQ